jgi:hypothetical protein
MVLINSKSTELRKKGRKERMERGRREKVRKVKGTGGRGRKTWSLLR